MQLWGDSPEGLCALARAFPAAWVLGRTEASCLPSRFRLLGW